MPNISDNSLNELKEYYDKTLNNQEKKSSNDEPTPIPCVEEMISKIPEELWTRKDLKILDPCCGNGNFFLPIFYKLLKYGLSPKHILQEILHFNDTNNARLNIVNQVFYPTKNITNNDYLTTDLLTKFDLIVANPPYAKFQKDGSRASKNHNLISSFLEKSLSQLKPDGYLLYITPDNWMSMSNRNTLISKLTSLQIIHLDIHTAKKYFKKIGSSFTWYIIQNKAAYTKISISGIWKKQIYHDEVASMKRNFIPLLYTQTVQNIFLKTIDNEKNEKYSIQTSSYLHKFTKKDLFSTEQNETFKYRVIHTPKQTIFSSKAHKFQEGWKVFISLTDKYSTFLEKDCGMTQSIAFILCESKERAENTQRILSHPIYTFLNNVCRYGNFNNVRILQKMPKFPAYYAGNKEEIYNFFDISKEEIRYLEENL